jgi:hypothetical protein
MPVMAATPVMSTARPSHASQLMTNDSIHVAPTLRTPCNLGNLLGGERFLPVEHLLGERMPVVEGQDVES